MHVYRNLLPGDAAPWFTARSTTRADHQFDTAGGRYIALCFFASAADASGKAAIDAALAHADLFDDVRASFFGISIDPEDEAQGRVTARMPGFRFFWDFDGQISRLYGALPRDAVSASEKALRRIWVVLDPTLRVMKVVRFTQDRRDANEFVDYLRSLPPPSRFAGFEVQAPILVLPHVFDPEFCAKLMTLHETHGAKETGFMCDVDGRTVERYDHGYKRRTDHFIEDQDIIRQIQLRFIRAVLPELRKVYQFKASRMERYLVGCYRAEDGGHFVPHRDNTNKGTAHRCFAASVNLNADFDGGEVRFPEYGPRGFKPLPGEAVVFSCSLLHAVSKVTRGRRYAFLPFLYDEDGAKVREANKTFVDEGADKLQTR